MKKLIIPSLLAGLLLASCSGNSKNSNTGNAADTLAVAKAETPANAPAEQVVIKDSPLQNAYPRYERLQKALVESNAHMAIDASRELETVLKLGKQDELAKLADSVAKAKDLEAQRAAFLLLSAAYIEKIREAGIESGELYVQHCPMAFDNKGGSWLSSSREILNPYFGDQMLHCGEVQETIKKQ